MSQVYEFDASWRPNPVICPRCGFSFVHGEPVLALRECLVHVRCPKLIARDGCTCQGMDYWECNVADPRCEYRQKQAAARG